MRHASATHSIGRLVSISIGEHKEAAVYVRGQASAAQKVGLPLRRPRPGPRTLTQPECKAGCVAMNDDGDVPGVVLPASVPAAL